MTDQQLPRSVVSTGYMIYNSVTLAPTGGVFPRSMISIFNSTNKRINAKVEYFEEDGTIYPAQNGGIFVVEPHKMSIVHFDGFYYNLPPATGGGTPPEPEPYLIPRPLPETAQDDTIYNKPLHAKVTWEGEPSDLVVQNAIFLTSGTGISAPLSPEISEFQGPA